MNSIKADKIDMLAPKGRATGEATTATTETTAATGEITTAAAEITAATGETTTATAETTAATGEITTATAETTAATGETTTATAETTAATGEITAATDKSTCNKPTMGENLSDASVTATTGDFLNTTDKNTCTAPTSGGNSKNKRATEGKSAQNHPPYAMMIEEQHLTLVAELEKACFYSPWSADALRLLIGENALGAVIIENGRALAYAGMTAVLDEGAITNVATHPDARRRGLAEAVLSFLLAKGEEKGLTTFSLEVRETNAPAIRLYEKLGFVALGRRRNFYRHPSEDALIMVKQITES